MKRLYLAILAALVLAAPAANAQYYQLANQVTNMLGTVFTGGAAYRGMADVGYTFGVGSKQADILEITTTQGVQITPNFFMGLGLGVDVMFTDVPDAWQQPPTSILGGHGFTQTGVAIPLFSDFRFNWAGAGGGPGFFIDARIGAAFLAGNDYIQIGDGVLTNSEFFYLRPAIGMRIPLSAAMPKVALNISASYQLLTSSYWYVSSNSQTLNSIGVNLGIEW